MHGAGRHACACNVYMIHVDNSGGGRPPVTEDHRRTDVASMGARGSSSCWLVGSGGLGGSHLGACNLGSCVCCRLALDRLTCSSGSFLLERLGICLRLLRRRFCCFLLLLLLLRSGCSIYGPERCRALGCDWVSGRGLR